MSQDYNMNYVDDSKQRYSDVDALSIHGRIGGKRYFVYSTILPAMVFWAIATIAALASFVPALGNTLFNIIMGVSILATLWMMVHLTIQRCHDFNKNGSFALLAIIPFANIIFALIPGTNGLNSYGELPKPANWLLNIVFYALIASLLALLIYAGIQFTEGYPISQILPF